MDPPAPVIRRTLFSRRPRILSRSSRTGRRLSKSSTRSSPCLLNGSRPIQHFTDRWQNPENDFAFAAFIYDLFNHPTLSRRDRDQNALRSVFGDQLTQRVGVTEHLQPVYFDSQFAGIVVHKTDRVVRKIGLGTQLLGYGPARLTSTDNERCLLAVVLADALGVGADDKPRTADERRS